MFMGSTLWFYSDPLPADMCDRPDYSMHEEHALQTQYANNSDQTLLYNSDRASCLKANSMNSGIME